MGVLAYYPEAALCVSPWDPSFPDWRTLPRSPDSKLRAKSPSPHIPFHFGPINCVSSLSFDSDTQIGPRSF